MLNPLRANKTTLLPALVPTMDAPLSTSRLPHLKNLATQFDEGNLPFRILPALWQATKPVVIDCPTPHHRAKFASQDSDFELSADIYLPGGQPPEGGWPAALVVYGGAFLFGHKDASHTRNVVNAFRQRGIATVAVEYRKIPQTHFPRSFRALRRWFDGNLRYAVGDVTRAIAWYGDHASKHGMAPGRLAVAGFSAGAMLASLAAAHNPDKVSGLVGFYGPYDPNLFGGLFGRILRFALYGTSVSQDERRHYFPIASPYFGPALLVQGDADDLCHPAHTLRYAAARQRAGVETYLHVESGLAHGFMNDPAAESPAVARSLSHAADFLERVFKER